MDLVFSDANYLKGSFGIILLCSEKENSETSESRRGVISQHGAPPRAEKLSILFKPRRGGIQKNQYSPGPFFNRDYSPVGRVIPHSEKEKL